VLFPPFVDLISLLGSRRLKLRAQNWRGKGQADEKKLFPRLPNILLEKGRKILEWLPSCQSRQIQSY
jgi:hypothetical protein